MKGTQGFHMDSIVRCSLLLLSLLSFGIGFYRLYFGIVNSNAFLVVAFVLLCIAFFSRFKRIKFLGFEAEMWHDKQLEAEKLITEINEKFKKFRELALLVSEIAFSAAASMGRLNPMPLNYTFGIHKELLDLLERNKYNKNEILLCTRVFNHLIGFDLIRPIGKEFVKEMKKKLKPINDEIEGMKTITPDKMEHHKELIEKVRLITTKIQEFKNIVYVEFGVCRPSVDEICRFAIDNDLLDKDDIDRIKVKCIEEIFDYTSFIETGQIRRLDKYINTQK